MFRNLKLLDIIGLNGQGHGHLFPFPPSPTGSDALWIAEALQCAPALTRVRCSASMFHKYQLFSHHSIQRLAISDFEPSLSGNLFAAIRKMRNLRSLFLARSLVGSHPIAEREPLPFVEVSHELASQTLEILRIQICGYFVRRLSLESLALPSLVTLDLTAQDWDPQHFLSSCLPHLQSLRNFSLSEGSQHPARIIHLLYSLPDLEAFRVIETSCSPHSELRSKTYIQALMAELTSTSLPSNDTRPFLPSLKSLCIRELTPPLSYYHKVAMELLLSTLEADSARRPLTEVRLAFHETSAMFDRAVPLRSSRLSSRTLPKNLTPRLEALEGKGIRCGVFRFDVEWRWLKIFGSLERDEPCWILKELEEEEG
ncbi:hypothetical protein PQX77_015750 [Marasmius sp. AFHP31]|nr:hypothetical protein PQX77_015750 [Marasmius sp. AFHP31]